MLKSSRFYTFHGCLPFEIHPSGASRGVLIIHGYTGTPKELRYLGGRLADSGFGVSAPRLPGFGTCAEDLSRTHRNEWRRRVCDAWQDLRGRYNTVSVVGYSMGAVLALDLATRTNIDRLALLAPAIRTTKHKPITFTPFLSPFERFLPEIRTGWEPDELDDEEDRELGLQYRYKRNIKGLTQFYTLCRETERSLNRVFVPVSAVVSENDTVVPKDILDFLDQKLPRGLNSRTVVTGCAHDLPQGAEKETIANIIADWLN